MRVIQGKGAHNTTKLEPEGPKHLFVTRAAGRECRTLFYMDFLAKTARGTLKWKFSMHQARYIPVGRGGGPRSSSMQCNANGRGWPRGIYGGH